MKTRKINLGWEAENKKHDNENFFCKGEVLKKFIYRNIYKYYVTWANFEGKELTYLSCGGVNSSPIYYCNKLLSAFDLHEYFNGNIDKITFKQFKQI